MYSYASNANGDDISNCLFFNRIANQVKIFYSLLFKLSIFKFVTSSS